MNIKQVTGEVNLLLENGENIHITADQVHQMILENQQLSQINKLLMEQLKNISKSLEENEIEISEVKLEEILKNI